MGIRKTIGRLFGRGSGDSGSCGACKAVREALDRIRGKGQAIFSTSGGSLARASFDPAMWSNEIVSKYKDALVLGGFTVPEEDVCPLTRQIVLQELTELAIQNPGTSIRGLLGRAMQNGVTDDHELAHNLRELMKGKIETPVKLGPDVKIQASYSVNHFAHQVQVRRGNKVMSVLIDDLPIG